MSPNTPPRIPAGVWVLGFVSMLMDISSEMIHSLLPLFLVGTLGVSVLAVGIIEGLAESTALISKVFSGALSDYLGRRKGLAMVADTAPEDLRGTAFGFFNLMSGIAMLVSSVVAGLLWDRFGSSFTFMAGAAFAAITLLGIMLQPVTARQRRGP